MLREYQVRPSRNLIMLVSSGLAVAAVMMIVLMVGDGPDQTSPSGSVIDAALTRSAQTQAVHTPNPTTLASINAWSTVDALATQNHTPSPTDPPAQALATAHAEFEFADRRDGIRIAMDILQQLEPPDPERYEDYIVSAAWLAAPSPLPFPFSGVVDLPNPDEDLAGYQDAVYSDAFRAACELDDPVRYELCARNAVTDFPLYVRALAAVNAGEAIPLARIALQSPNKLVLDAAIHVLCIHQDLDSIPVMEARLAALDWPLPDMSAATGLLACGDEDADTLALELLEGDEALFDAMKEQVQAVYGP